MRAFITGLGGFIGSHLANLLLEKGIEVYGTVHVNGTQKLGHIINKIKTFDCDVGDKKELERVILSIEPDFIYHLAAQSLVIPSWNDPEKTFRSNIYGTFNVLEAARQLKNEPKIFVACSSAEYGLNLPEEIPIHEKKEFRPSSPYAVSKVATDMMSFLYWQTYKMKIIRGRLFNITGPRKKHDACSDFAKMVVETERGERDKIEVGNLEGIRDITDVRDCVKALWLLTEKAKYGDAYNICSGKAYKIKEILDTLISLSNKSIKVVQNKEKLRPLDDPIFVGDNSKIKQMGWEPKIPIEKTLSDILDYWRSQLK